MKLHFIRQQFQEDAASAVADVFEGQPMTAELSEDDVLWSVRGNRPVTAALDDRTVLSRIRRIQQSNGIEPSDALMGRYNLTVEMETGVGKTYTYIRTMYELNRRYGWCKFIIVVPSIAIREGVYDAFRVTEEHFSGIYGKKIAYFIYDSSRPGEIERFASDNAPHAMIINAQAFNAGDPEARRIYLPSDAFRSRRPIDLLAKTNPIMIIDEPQSVEGEQTRKSMESFHPLMTLRYSATHRSDSIYNMVYRLDAIEAYNRRLVKKIAVKGITETGGAAADGYVYLERLNLSASDPTATISFRAKGPDGIRTVSKKVGIGFDLYEASGELEAYRDRYVIRAIDGRDDSVELANGIRLFAGKLSDGVREERLRRIQIRETVLSHLDRERQLFDRRIKVLSLFFIDEVRHYRVYDQEGRALNGSFADMFEEIYEDAVSQYLAEAPEDDYTRYLRAISVKKTHAGYFSVDRKGRMIDSRTKRGETVSDDAGAYELIMRNKELLLEQDPEKSPVRFIFSHSALKEGWDNPNVFQICALKQSRSDIRKRQEVGRGMRLCVNTDGERMDETVLGDDVHQVNVLTVIAGESYDSFAKGLQSEIAEAVSTRPDRRKTIEIENAGIPDTTITIDEKKLEKPVFSDLWTLIRGKAVYQADFDTDSLIDRAIRAIDDGLKISAVSYHVETGVLKEIRSRDALLSGHSFEKDGRKDPETENTSRAGSSVRYDLIGRIVRETGLTRKTVIRILTGIRPTVFALFSANPEEFILRTANLINSVKASMLIRHVRYGTTGEQWDLSVFRDAALRGKPGVNVMETEKHLYSHLKYGSTDERQFAESLEADGRVIFYIRLPDRYVIPTPAGPYHPGWAIAFSDGAGRTVFAAADIPLRKGNGPESAEAAKRHCAEVCLRAVSGGRLTYAAARNFSELYDRIISADT